MDIEQQQQQQQQQVERRRIQSPRDFLCFLVEPTCYSALARLLIIVTVLIIVILALTCPKEGCFVFAGKLG
jgi:hypothetical protein